MAGLPDPPRVLVVDDHELLVQSLVIALHREGLDARAAPLDSPEAVVGAAEGFLADLVLLDLDLGGVLGDGTDLVQTLTTTGARVLVLTGSSDPQRAGRAIEFGAVGALRKDVALAELVRTAIAAAHGEAVMDLHERRSVIAAARTRRLDAERALAPFRLLSAREAQVLRALADGATVGRIAKEWHVSEATVRTQVRGVLTKLDVTGQLEAVALARRAGWLDLYVGT
ncbi:response regulator transcription factor [Nocardioides secundeburneus]|uniref:response regulator transcription factor n=1 Tax=Nocardioides sp. C4-1 TaxID=3151851 RepID=UPI0032630073